MRTTNRSVEICVCKMDRTELSRSGVSLRFMKRTHHGMSKKRKLRSKREKECDETDNNILDAHVSCDPLEDRRHNARRAMGVVSNAPMHRDAAFFVLPQQKKSCEIFFFTLPLAFLAKDALPFVFPIDKRLLSVDECQHLYGNVRNEGNSADQTCFEKGSTTCDLAFSPPSFF